MIAPRKPFTHRRISARRRRPAGGYRYVRLRWRMLFAVVDLLGTGLFAVGRWLRRSLLPITATAERAPRVILLVQLDHLGDAILTSVMLPALRRRYPAAAIEVLASPANRELFALCPEVDRVYVSQGNRFMRGLRLPLAWIFDALAWGLLLRRRGVDLAIDVRGDFSVALLLWTCGARRRVGWDCGGGGFLLTDRVRYVPGRAELASRRAVLRKLGIRLPRDARPQLRPHEETRRRVWERLDALDARGTWCNGAPSSGVATPGLRPRPRVVLHLGAGTAAKRWPVRHWRELLGRLALAHAPQIILIGSVAERGLADAVLQGRAWPGVTNWTGCLALDELTALIAAADVLVGADSGPAHLAAAVGTPAVVLFSGTNRPRQWRPRGPHITVLRHAVACGPCHATHCPLADHPCMQNLQPERVAAAVARAWLPVARPRAAFGEELLHDRTCT